MYVELLPRTAREATVGMGGGQALMRAGARFGHGKLVETTSRQHRRRGGLMNQLTNYINAWQRHDVSGVLETLTDDCVITECYGPVYRGKQRVEQWMRAWFDAGGSVDSWQITTQAAAGDTLTAEWLFSCTWQGKAATFEGASVARLAGGRIAYLREYATTAPLYDWTGTWRE